MQNHPFPLPGADPDSALRWYAVAVKPRHERTVAAVARSRGYEDFLPLYRSRRRWSDRIKQIDLPLFPGYVFCRLRLDNRLPVLMIPGVNSLVGAGKKPLPVEEREIEAVRSLCRSGLPIEPWQYLRAGQKVRILGGALDGLEGILAQERSACRVVVNVNLLERAVAVEIGRERLAPLEGVWSTAAGASRPAACR